MPNQHDTALSAIEEIVVRFAPKRQERTPITRETRLREDLEIDSPRMIDIVLEVEDRFAVTLEDDDIQNSQTVGDILDLVEQRAPAPRM